MTADSGRVIEVFTEAIQLPKSERSDFLDRVCIEDAGLRRKIEALLSSNDRAEGFLEEPPTMIGEGKAKADDKGKPGVRIGRYQLLRQIGEGGCGVVFVAEQWEPVRRRVALKLIKPGMDTKSVIARFEAERQALALMEHPNIAHVFDAGETESGRPYFVMELVEGEKFIDYCDYHSLPIAARLKLFVLVCDAIQHAHQKGIIHRDIKPSNILVTTGRDGKPVPKVIDFGIAKATTGLQLTEKTIFTSWGMLIGTPAYMSPEQASLTSAELDTRTDIYSLGVLLYELLTGTTPFDTGELLKVGFDEVRRVIRDEEPVRPSTRLSTMVATELVNVSKHHGEQVPKLIREMRGDLDWIVMNALEKDRQRRYATTNGLAMDIERYLAGETVLARPPSTTYKIRKLAARNKLLFSGVALIFVLLVISLITTTRWLMMERRARELMQLQVEIPRLESLGSDLFWTRKYKESEQAYRKALDLRRKGPGIDSAAEMSCNFLLTIFMAQKRLDKIRPLLSDVVDPALLSRGAFRDVYQTAVDRLARRGLWNDADALAAVLQKSIPSSPTSYAMRAPLLVAKGDAEEYRRICGEIISQFGKIPGPDFAVQMAKVCLILPLSGEDSTAVEAWVEKEVNSRTKDAISSSLKFCGALAKFRQGQYGEAMSWAQLAAESRTPQTKACASAVMAMSQFKLNQLDKARTALADCNKVIENNLPKLQTDELSDLGDSWRDWIIACALRSEAKQLIDPSSPPHPADLPR